MDAVTKIVFPQPVRGRAIKIVQTGRAEGLFWSIHELTVESQPVRKVGGETVRVRSLVRSPAFPEKPGFFACGRRHAWRKLWNKRRRTRYPDGSGFASGIWR